MKIEVIKNKKIGDYKEWGIWECEKSKFDWSYSSEEHCYIIEGKALITFNQEIVTIQSGDYVIFPKNLDCNWEILSPIKKYYTFK